MAKSALDDIDPGERYRRMFDESRTGLAVARANAEKARRYYDDKQLDEPTKRTLKRRGQPQTIRNEIKPAINGVLGVIEQAKVDPRAYPRNPQDENSADVASKALRYIADQGRFQVMKIDALDNHLVEGACAGIVEMDGKTIVPRRIRYEEFFFDPRAREADYKDARYLGIAKWLYAADVAALYPDYADVVNSVASGTWSSAYGGGEGFDDKPTDGLMPWVDKRQRRLMVCEMYERVGREWRRCVFFAGGVLEEGPSPYTETRDGETRSICPIEGSSCFIDGENLGRVGIVQSMLPLQDELNARASRLLHLTNTRQLQVADPNNPPTEDADEARKQAGRADGVIPSGYQVVQTADMAAGNAAIMGEVKQSITRQAPTPQVLSNTEPGNQSGRARLVRQQAGMTELARPLGRFEDWENRMYRQMWLRAVQFKTEPWWVRVTDTEGALEFLQINEPVWKMQPKLDPSTGQPMLDEDGEPQMEPVMAPQPVPGPDGQPIVDPQTGQPQMRMAKVPEIDPKTGQQKVNHRLAEMDMDIIVDTVPDTANLQAETFEIFSQLAPQIAQAYGPKATVDMLLAASPMPNKSDMRDALEKGAKDMQAQQAQAQQQQAANQAKADQFAQATATANIEKTRSEAAKNDATAEKTKVETAQVMAEGLAPLHPAYAPPQNDPTILPQGAQQGAVQA